MPLENTKTSWGWPARLLHWSSGLVILFLLGVGTYMANFVSDIYLQFSLTQTHKSWGFVAFVLIVLRLLWRARTRTPEPPAGQPRLERLAARAGHIALYVAIILMPISGWLMASASPLQESYGIQNMVFGLFELPDPFVPGSAELEKIFKTIHTGTAITLGVLVAVHVGAALKHHFVSRDNVLRRMIRG